MRVLVTEDDARMAALLGQALTEADHEVRVVGSGERAIDALHEDAYDLLLLDVMLPRLDGFATCRRIRERGEKLGILMLTARDDVHDRIRGLDAGADDYLGKPFSLEELLARVRAFERRDSARYGRRLTVGELTLDLDAPAAWRDGERIDLTQRECAVLEALMREAGRAVHRERIIVHAWPEGADHRSNVLEVLIGRIREKVDRPFATDSIKTVRGLGYRMDAT